MTPLPRHAARTDKNQPAIVAALKAAGCSVAIIGRPVDLLVGLARRNYLLEIKSSNRKRRDQPEQDAFLRDWQGQVAKVRSVDEAFRAVGLLGRED